MDNQNWYYALSAIAQTSGALLALGGAFIIFKLDKAYTAILNYKDRLIKIIILPHFHDREINYLTIPNIDIYDKVNNNKVSMSENPVVHSSITRFDNMSCSTSQQALYWIDKHLYCLDINIDAEVQIKRYFKIVFIILSIIFSSNLFFLAFERLPHYLYLALIIFSVAFMVYNSIIFWRILNIKYFT
ncbi:hypothetical protein KKG41_04500 [Patescibacteria group bacterium]|nr:hypothetical protein [Patescibacteria group bacterium]